MKKEQMGMQVSFNILPDSVVMQTGTFKEEVFSSFEDIIEKKTKEAKREKIKGTLFFSGTLGFIGGIAFLVGEFANGRNFIYSAGIIATVFPLFMQQHSSKAYENSRLAKAQIKMAEYTKNNVVVEKPFVDSARRQNSSMN